MVSKRILLAICLLVFVVMVASSWFTSPALAANAKYLVLASHTPEECLNVLDDVKEKGTKLLSKFDWGCMTGDHTGYLVIEAKDEEAVKGMLPSSMQGARIVKLNKFTAGQIKSFHEKK